MKKNRLLNPQLSQVIASLGHGQRLTVCDCGLPIESSAERIDMALTQGVPTFMETLGVVLSEMIVERAIIAEEFAKISPMLYAQFISRIEALGQQQGKAVEVVVVSHKEFKGKANEGRAVVRTGECTPYANVILTSGVAF